MSATQYINKPGGAILHMEDGSQVTVGYGGEVPEGISDVQRQHLSAVADSEKRAISPDQAAFNDALKQAHGNAALAHPGVNSSADIVPSDYSMLDEAGCIALVRSLESYPEAQAQVVLHEMVNYGRQIVVDAASGAARRSAQNQLDQVKADVIRNHSVVGEPKIVGNDGEEQTPEPENTESDLDKALAAVNKAKKPELEATAKALDLSADGTVPELKDRISEELTKRDAAQSENGEGSETPPPNPPGDES